MIEKLKKNFLEKLFIILLFIKINCVGQRKR